MKVFVLSRNRPIYLWACLDSLYRLTRTACRFIIIDSASDDPLVRPVIEGFERRGMFSEIVWLKRNEASLVLSTIVDRLNDDDDLFAFVESDVLLLPGGYGCWLERMRELMDADPLLAMLGSFVDPTDLVPMEAARLLTPHLTEEELLLLTHNKYFRPELSAGFAASELVISPHTPAGRLLMLRRDAALRAGAASDSDLHDRLLALGYRTGISTEVRHRHLSLCNIFDYPAYDTSKRSRFMYGYTYKAHLEEKIADRSVVPVEDPDVHVRAGTRRIDAAVRDGGVLRFEIPADAERLTLESRIGFALNTPDIRPLGVAINRLVADGIERLEDEGLVKGWYGLEDGWRWTSGRAELPRCSTLDVHVVGTVNYILHEAENSTPAR